MNEHSPIPDQPANQRGNRRGSNHGGRRRRRGRRRVERGVTNTAQISSSSSTGLDDASLKRKNQGRPSNREHAEQRRTSQPGATQVTRVTQATPEPTVTQVPAHEAHPSEAPAHEKPAHEAHPSKAPAHEKHAHEKPAPEPTNITPSNANPSNPSSTNQAKKPTKKHVQFSSPDVAPYVFVSIQTNGIHPSTSRLLSLAVSTTDEQGNIVDSWHVVVDPKEDPGPQHLHGLTTKDFAGAPQFGIILSKLNFALDGRTLVTHDAPRVWGFIIAEAKRARRQANRENRRNRGRRRNGRARVGRIPAPSQVVDTLATARRQGVPLPDTRLRGVARAYGVDVPSPVASLAGREVPESVRTLDDVTTTIKLFAAEAGFDPARPKPIAGMSPEELKADSVGLQRSVVRVAAVEAPRPVDNPGTYQRGKNPQVGMEFAVAPEVIVDPDELISAGVAAGLVYSEKVTRKTSLLVCNQPANVTPEQLVGKAMHAHRKGIPLVSDEAFLRLVEQVSAQ